MRSRRYPPAQLQGTTNQHFAPGSGAQQAHFRPGDFILTHGDSFLSRFIRLGQSLAFWGRDRKYIWWSHAAMIVSAEGDLIEAVGAGVRRGHLREYEPADYHIVQLNQLADDGDRRQMVRYAEWTLGQEYGLLTNISIVISVLFGCRFTFGFDGQSICSGLVARALERGSAIFDRSPSHILPADLARYFDVQPPGKGARRGRRVREKPRIDGVAAVPPPTGPLP